MLRHFNLDLVIPAVKGMGRSVVGDGILVAQFVADILKRLVQIVHVIRIESAASGFFRQRLQNLVSIGQVILAVPGSFLARIVQRHPLRAGADRVDHHAAPLGHFDGFRTRVRRKVVLAVADQDHHPANHIRLVPRRTRRVAELLHAGLINSIVNGSAAPRAGAQNLVAQLAGVRREGLDNLRLVVESHHERLILAAAQNTE